LFPSLGWRVNSAHAVLLPLIVCGGALSGVSQAARLTPTTLRVGAIPPA
jgi:hypothetical protein